MATLKLFLFSLIFLALVVQQCLSLNCTYCAAGLCEKKDKDKWVGTVCPTDTKNMTFTCVKINYSDGKTKKRDCMSTYDCKAYAKCYSCKNKDHCNSSSSLTPLYIITVVSAAILRFY